MQSITIIIIDCMVSKLYILHISEIHLKYYFFYSNYIYLFIINHIDNLKINVFIIK